MKANRVVLLSISIIIIFGVSLAVSYFAFGQGAKPEESFAVIPTAELVSSAETAVPAQERASEPSPPAAYLAQPISAEEMFSEFICPCCGQPIGECSCGMAGERRGFVTGLVSTPGSLVTVAAAAWGTRATWIASSSASTRTAPSSSATTLSAEASAWISRVTR